MGFRPSQVSQNTNIGVWESAWHRTGQARIPGLGPLVSGLGGSEDAGFAGFLPVEGDLLRV